ncbi:MAG: amino acid adenylation domain-containing protein [Clostridia bacterium]|nr:amino acid adenylation domain-containing protein [Clostridia bacterium]NCC75363.1 amino acid adenylation domain-containing protein [Clostridia bacterium]
MKIEEEGLVQDSDIDRLTYHRHYPLTYPQRGVWFLEKINPDTGIGNLAVTLKFNQVIDYVTVNQAVNLLLAQNEGFRTRIRQNQDGEASQYFAPFEPYVMPRLDFSLVDKEMLYQWDRTEVRRPFELDQNLYYFAYVKIDSQSSALFMRFHHLIADAWSFVQIGNDLMAFYDRLCDGRGVSEPENPSYRDFIVSEQNYIESERYHLDKEFWRSQFSTLPTLTTLKTRTTERIGLTAKRRSYALPEKLTSKIREYCHENRTSIFALFFAAMSIYINRIRDQEDIVIGTPVLNRSNAREKRTIGMFISTVPLRVQMDNHLTFQEFSRKLDTTWFSVLKHQKYPYDLLLRDVRESYPDVEKLFDIAISYQNGKINRSQEGLAGNAEVRWHFTEHQTEALYLHINEREGESQILLNYDYLTDLFYAKEIDYIHDHMLRLLWHALDNPQRPISHIHMLSEKERYKVLTQFNQTEADYPRKQTVTGLFEAQADRSPHSPALVIGKKSYTYDTLDQLAERIARELRQAGARKESIIALYMHPSLTLVASILGVIKAGAAYLPIDPEYPSERVSYMLENSGARILLKGTRKSGPAGFDGTVLDASAITADALHQKANGLRLPRQLSTSEPSNLLYVIYTSGSTGRPKGVMIEHRNVVRLLFNDRNLFDFGPQDCWTLFHSYCFDFSVWEMYGALLYGGRLVIVPKPVARDTHAFRKLLADHQVTILNQTPAAFYNLSEHEIQKPGYDLSVRMVIFGGDALKPQLLRPFHTKYPGTRLINMYGITETTVHVTHIELKVSDLLNGTSNVGRPIPTMRVYILDKNLNPMPIGAPGEIFVSGAGVGRGYLNNPELTSARFLPNPFEPGEKLYRSGDLGRFFPEGDIEYLGRIDHQVKIRGHRIELGEIESALLDHSRIRAARVLTTENGQGSKQLVAYFVPAQPITNHELRTFLTKSLPEYMIPTFFVALERIPLNSNGKIAREKLPKPDLDTVPASEFSQPVTALEIRIAAAFSEVLECSEIGLEDHFFRLGGDSLSAARLVAILGDPVTFADLYSHPTVSDLAQFMQNQKSSGSGSLLVLHQSTARRHLVVFPYAGGTAATYLTLSQQIGQSSDDMNVIAANLPQQRLPQHQMAEIIAHEIMQELTGDLYFYSHCAGSSLAIETALLLEKLGRPPVSVLLGASLPPAAPRRHNALGFIATMFQRGLYRLLENPWRYLSDKSLLKILSSIGLRQVDMQPGQIESMISLFRQDAAEFYTFFNRIRHERQLGQSDVKLSSTIHCIIGDQDPVTMGAKRHYQRWNQFSDQVDLTILPDAGHYFLGTQTSELSKWILRTINRSSSDQYV